MIAVFTKKPIQLPYRGHLIDLKFKPANNFFSKIINFFIRWKKIHTIKKRLNADVVVSFMQAPNVLNLLTKNTAQTIISIRNYDFRKYSEVRNPFLRLEHFLLRFLINKADKIVTVSSELSELTRKKYRIVKNKIVTIHNGCDVREIKKKASQPLPPNLDALFKWPTLINSGKIEPQKGQHQLIKIYSFLVKEIRDLKLIILGRGSLKSELIDYSESLGLKCWQYDIDSVSEIDSSNVFFMGFQNNPYNFFLNSSVFVLSSLYEGFPNVVIEAMACGLPVVAADCKTGPKEIILDEKNPNIDYGILLPEFDINEKSLNKPTVTEQLWIDKISELLNNRSEILKYRKLSEIRVRNFTVEKLVTRWTELISTK